MKYYLINNKIMKGSEMPDNKKLYPASMGMGYGAIYNKWLSSLQPCEISESELDKVKVNLKLPLDFKESIDVTDIVEDNNGVITFKGCQCLKCSPIEFSNFRFNVCCICGNKRCPHASDHNYKCTNSNEPNQLGSVYCEHPKQVDGEIEAVELIMFDLIQKAKEASKIMTHEGVVRLMINQFNVTRK